MSSATAPAPPLLPTASAAAPTLNPSRIHVPVLDGVRGAAVLLVMFHHMTFTHSPAWPDRVLSHAAKFGWSGVDLFFVLSGFLITGILYDAKNSDRYFKNFYVRRVLRIFPLYYAVIFFAAVIVPRFTADPRLHLDHHGVWYWTYFQNIGRAWFGAKSNFLVDVTWSLAIEEQYYMLWPLVVFFLSRRALLAVSLGLAIVSGVWRIVLLKLGANFDAVYVTTFSHLDGIALGSWLALVARGPGAGLSRLRPHAGWVAAAALLCLAAISIPQWHVLDTAFFATPRMQAVGYAALSAFYASLLVLALTLPAQSPIPRLFASRWLRWFGRYSYGLYLVHFPIAVIARQKFPPARFPAIAGSHVIGQFIIYLCAGGLSIILALLSWNLLERHFLKLKDRFTEPSFKARHVGEADGADAKP
jgi:peptidoglycan/LPS O-acetylase OafA/YrhL